MTDTLPTQFVILHYEQGGDIWSAWVDASCAPQIEDAVGVFHQRAGLKDWTLALPMVTGAVVHIPVSRICSWCESSPERFAAELRLDCVREKLSKEVRDEALGKEWES
jgi:hypothetical protein